MRREVTLPSGLPTFPSTVLIGDSSKCSIPVSLLSRGFPCSFAGHPHTQKRKKTKPMAFYQVARITSRIDYYLVEAETKEETVGSVLLGCEIPYKTTPLARNSEIVVEEIDKSRLLRFVVNSDYEPKFEKE
jgi:hypothetical protein